MAEVRKTYHPTGELKSEVFEINGKRNGIYKEYRKNGQLKGDCFFIDDEIQGELKLYHENGHQRVHLVLPAVRRR
jgi:antitoxin component YwqK of YwqJK toxin-antitoxin module